MKRTSPIKTAFLVSLGCLLPLVAGAQLEWRVSVKFILDSSGNLPALAAGSYGAQSTPLTNHLAVTNQIATANDVLDHAGRGYRYALTEVVDLGGVSQWFTTDARSAANRTALETAATADAASKVTYAWRDDAINVYINGSGSGVCSIPSSSYHLIFLGVDAYNTIFVHEAGHFFSLLHTHQGESGCADHCPGCTDPKIPGDADGVGDTLPDHECWTRDNIAMNSFGGRTFAMLNDAEQNQVLNVFTNIMSYHLPQDRFTPDQLDRMTDASNDPSQRRYVATGRTWFMSTAGNDSAGNGSSTSPYRSLGQSALFASSGDIVLLRTGNYDERLTITKHLTLRATRGVVNVGRP